MQFRIRPAAECQLIFQITGLGGVVVHPRLIHHPGDRVNQIRPETDRAQKPVLNPQQWELTLSCHLKQTGRVPTAPDHEGIGSMSPSLPEPGELQPRACEETFEVALLPGGESVSPGADWSCSLNPPLEADRPHQILNRAKVPAVGIDAFGMFDQTGVDQLLKGSPAARRAGDGRRSRSVPNRHKTASRSNAQSALIGPQTPSGR